MMIFPCKSSHKLVTLRCRCQICRNCSESHTGIHFMCHLRDSKLTPQQNSWLKLHPYWPLNSHFVNGKIMIFQGRCLRNHQLSLNFHSTSTCTIFPPPRGSSPKSAKRLEPSALESGRPWWIKLDRKLTLESMLDPSPPEKK